MAVSFLGSHKMGSVSHSKEKFENIRLIRNTNQTEATHLGRKQISPGKFQLILPRPLKSLKSWWMDRKIWLSGFVKVPDHK